jgi:hypothetical protein
LRGNQSEFSDDAPKITRGAIILRCPATRLGPWLLRAFRTFGYDFLSETDRNNSEFLARGKASVEEMTGGGTSDFQIHLLRMLPTSRARALRQS